MSVEKNLPDQKHVLKMDINYATFVTVPLFQKFCSDEMTLSVVTDYC